MLDTLTLRVAFGLVAACVLVLFYGVTYRSTRSSYSGWWCASLACFIVSASLFLANGTPAQVLANPMGNATGALGAACVWAGGRSLRERRIRAWQVLVGPGLVLVVSLADSPRTDIWSGGAVYLAAMALLIGASARELTLLLRALEPGVATRAQYRFVLTAMALASAVIALFYLARTIAFVAVGPADPLFRAVFGGQVTTLLMMVLLVVVTFSMSALSHEQQTSELRVQATRDGLTGLLNRAEFLRAAQREIDRGLVRADAAVVVADLDRFKSINDGLGHAAGDRALTAFADACRSVVGLRGVIGRLGGDEFVLLVRGAPAEVVLDAIARVYRGDDEASPMPTVSFGIAPVRAGDDIALALAYADEALYEAKAAGRARAVRAARRDDRPPSLVDDRRSA
ncbi:GGDEF domain-containing protein [Nocardioides nitrophenolicus]|uniref:GGDEF domain-containing protein n=1 Tax=Nocardioides nitrophenolicus TaxID=60489 RepID=UPI001958C95D|nr:GGDEF domain-containing protein [Nocardioides nitrophenolicus]MBM7519241.1 diguanylate cyclase (GGDEF)-like protein [Nocardioides nitrophenolicus]